jgi:cation diffusion facilitator family transporter
MSPPSVETAVRSTITGMIVNAVMAVVKITTGILGNSYALIADGIESVADVFSSGVVLFALRVSARPPDEDHPYGHGKAEQLAALFSSIAILIAGGVIAYESARNLFTPHPVPSGFTLPILLLVVVVKETLARYVLTKGTETGSTAVKGDAWHHRSDAITSGAALVGIVIALIGGERFAIADDVAALVGCAVFFFNGYRLLRTALHENMDGAAQRELHEDVRQIAAAVAGVRQIEKMRIRKYGMSYHMDIHVQVPRTMTVEEGHRVGHEVERSVRSAGLRIDDVVVHLEPHGESLV